MPLVIGVDEAGYGPNLGPLVIAATVWRVPEFEFAWYERLRAWTTCDPAKTKHKLLVADSKVAFRAGAGLRTLEESVLTLSKIAYGKLPERANDLLERLQAVGLPDEVPSEPPAYFDDAQLRLPCEAALERVHRLAARVAGGLQEVGCTLERLAARIVAPAEFNELLKRHENKSAVLSACTLQLVARLLRRYGDEVAIYCDRHGGRAYYAALVQQYLTEHCVQVLEETPVSSSYRWTESTRCCHIRFKVDGETELPTAAGSMIAKYVRELWMRNWNRFWLQHDATLRPTAGYPGDASRFFREIRPIQRRLCISDHAVWRNK